MRIKVNNIVSISEANQNSSKVAQKVNEDGEVLIMKDNQPKYILADYEAILSFIRERVYDL